MKASQQQALPGMAVAFERRCDLCDQKMKPRKVCKWCRKGGGGEPPQPRGPTWKRWIRGLIKTCSRRMRESGHDEAMIGKVIEALFMDRGRVPLDVKDLVREYDERPISGRRYWREIDTAVLSSQIHSSLVRGGFTPEEADRISGRAAPRIMEQREIEAADPEAPKVSARDILHEEAVRELGEEQVSARVAAAGPRVALGRIGTDEDGGAAGEEEAQAGEEDAATAPARARIAW